jgi:hypothetical protein
MLQQAIQERIGAIDFVLPELGLYPFGIGFVWKVARSIQVTCGTHEPQTLELKYVVQYVSLLDQILAMQERISAIGDL